LKARTLGREEAGRAGRHEPCLSVPITHLLAVLFGGDAAFCLVAGIAQCKELDRKKRFPSGVEVRKAYAWHTSLSVSA